MVPLVPTEGSKESPDRTQTDDSLRSERDNIDRVVAEKQAWVEAVADRVVDRAREHADAVLVAARHEADARLDRPGATGHPGAVLTDERTLEDDVLRDERASADERIRYEREQSTRALLALLPMERDATDSYLLTERVRADDAIASRDDFLGIVSHELRNLLGGILTAAGLVSKMGADAGDGDRARRGAERIQRYAARMNRLIGDLVDVASIDAGRLAVHPVPGDLVLLIADAIETFAGAASAKGLSLAARVTERTLPAPFDYERMLQILANLITNAIKFTPSGGILVHGARVADGIRLSVSDTGGGIPADMLEAIFERFRQVTDNDARGLGLGLYISRCLVHAHGGTMWAECRNGEGATIHLTIPVTTGRR
jgi:signal transduction histidine kinase